MDNAHRERIAELRAQGLTPKEIGKALKLHAAEVAEVVREFAGQHPVVEKPPAFLECYVSRSWRQAVTLADPGRAPPEWREEAKEEGLPLVELVVIAGDSPSRVDRHVFLIDTGALGVKDCYSRKDLVLAGARNFVAMLAERNEEEFERISPETARELVFGAVEYAR
ncbi:MAG: hypothetical protein AB2A00_36780, partial [Myxococcota bacterium]